MIDNFKSPADYIDPDYKPSRLSQLPDQDLETLQKVYMDTVTTLGKVKISIDMENDLITTDLEELVHVTKQKLHEASVCAKSLLKFVTDARNGRIPDSLFSNNKDWTSL